MSMSPGKNKFRWGIVGTGHAAKKFANDLYFLSGHGVEAVSSRDKARAASFAQKYGARCSYEGYEKLVESQQVDAIYIAADTSLHCDLSSFFLSNKVPVLCEKPLSTNLACAVNVVDFASTTGVLFTEAMWSLYLPSIKRLRAEVARGVIGEVLHIEASCGRKFDKDTQLRVFSKHRGGGSLYDTGVYGIALMTCLLGKLDVRYAHSQLNEFGTDNSTTCILKSKKSHVTFSTSIVFQLSNSMTISGDRGYIVVEKPFYDPKKFVIYDLDGGVLGGYESKYVGSGMREQASYFSQLIEEKKTESDIYTGKQIKDCMTTMRDISLAVGLTYA